MNKREQRIRKLERHFFGDDDQTSGKTEFPTRNSYRRFSITIQTMSNKVPG